MRRALESASAGTFSLDGTVALSRQQARRPLALAGSNRPVILLAENRESTRVALKKVLEANGFDVIVIEHASEALSVGVEYDKKIAVLEQPVRLDVFANKVSEMIATLQGIQQSGGELIG